jgi:hypothetical protein
MKNDPSAQFGGRQSFFFFRVVTPTRLLLEDAEETAVAN